MDGEAAQGTQASTQQWFSWRLPLFRQQEPIGRHRQRVPHGVTDPASVHTRRMVVGKAYWAMLHSPWLALWLLLNKELCSCYPFFVSHCWPMGKEEICCGRSKLGLVRNSCCIKLLVWPGLAHDLLVPRMQLGIIYTRTCISVYGYLCFATCQCLVIPPSHSFQRKL